jgi:hypothetical protein
MRSLRGAIPRAFTSHKTPDGHAYRRYVMAIMQQHGWTSRETCPPACLVTLREAGRLAVELQAVGRELELARAHKRRRDVARLRRQLTPMRSQLLMLERRLEELAKSTRRGGLARLLTEVQR